MNKQAKIGTVILIIILLILLCLAVFYIFSQMSGNIVSQIVDPCEGEFQECNHACGEGILSSICKEKCSYDYRECKKG